jgi:hypothetical protein
MVWSMNAKTLSNTYISMWNEPDADRRRATIHALWHPDAEHILDPPDEFRATAARVGFPNPTLTVRGHAELEVRVTRAYDEFVGPGTMRFAITGEPHRVGDALMLAWQGIPADGSDPGAGGTDILLLAADGRILRDYQFIAR